MFDVETIWFEGITRYLFTREVWDKADEERQFAAKAVDPASKTCIFACELARRIGEVFDLGRSLATGRPQLLGPQAARPPLCSRLGRNPPGERRTAMNSLIYLIGLIVVILAILSFLGLR